jgi:DNA topoisomerase VI subunit A
MENNNDDEDNERKPSQYEIERGKRIKRNHERLVLLGLDRQSYASVERRPSLLRSASATTNGNNKEKCILFQDGSIELHILYSILGIRASTHDDKGNNSNNDDDCNKNDGDDDIGNNNNNDYDDNNNNDNDDNNENGIHNNNDDYGSDDDGSEGDKNRYLNRKKIDRIQVLNRTESSVAGIPESLNKKTIPVLVQYIDQYSDPKMAMKKKYFTNTLMGRSAKYILLVMGFCHRLLRSTDKDGRPKTSYIQTLWYTYNNYFNNKDIMNRAIQNTCKLLNVTREDLGLKASSKGWCCGNFKLMDDTGFPRWNGETYRGDEGFLITSKWLKEPEDRTFSIDPHTSATCIVVVESESFYQILVQDRFWFDHECILVTGKGFPDAATRACVFALHKYLRLPVYGLTDCNPYGIHVLHTYQNGYQNKYGVPVQWLGLRPSQVKRFLEPKVIVRILYPGLPEDEFPALQQDVFQEKTYRDLQMLKIFLKKDCTHPFIATREASRAEARVKEIRKMLLVKVELEALCSLGSDFCSSFLGILLERAKLKKDPTEEWNWKDII